MEMLSLSLLIPRGLARSSPLSWQGAHCIPALLQPTIFCPPYGQSLLGTWAGVVVPWGRVFFCLRMVLCLCSNSNLALRSPSHNLFLSHPTSLGPLSPRAHPNQPLRPLLILTSCFSISHVASSQMHQCWAGTSLLSHPPW